MSEVKVQGRWDSLWGTFVEMFQWNWTQIFSAKNRKGFHGLASKERSRSLRMVVNTISYYYRIAMILQVYI